MLHGLRVKRSRVRITNNDKEKTSHEGWIFLGAGEETLTLDLFLGKEAL